MQFDEYLVLKQDTVNRTITPIYLCFANKFGKEERTSSDPEDGSPHFPLFMDVHLKQFVSFARIAQVAQSPSLF